MAKNFFNLIMKARKQTQTTFRLGGSVKRTHKVKICATAGNVGNFQGKGKGRPGVAFHLINTIFSLLPVESTESIYDFGWMS